MTRTLLRRASSAFTVLLFTLLLVGAPTAVAHADLGPINTDCKTAPTPTSPEAFPYPGSISPQPEDPQKVGDPFAPNTTTGLYEAYSWAAIGSWSTYDLGCGPDAAVAPDAIVNNSIANLMAGIAVWISAAAAGLVYFAFNPGKWIGFFDPLVKGTVDALADNLFVSVATIMVFAVAGVIMWQSHRANMAGAIKSVGWIMLVIVGSLVLFNYPVQSAKVADEMVLTAQSQVYSVAQGQGKGNTPQSSAMGAVYDNVFYRQWLSGELGSPDAEVAKKYGDELFRASNYSWKEWDKAKHDKGYRQKLEKDKAKLWDDTAAKIKDEDSSAYKTLTGKTNARLGAAFAMMFGAATTLPFIVVSAIAVIASLIMIRGLVMIAPLALALSVLPRFSGIATGMCKTALAAALNAVAFSLIAAIYLAGVRILYNGHLPTILSSILLGILGFALYYLAKPFRRMHTMVGIDRLRKDPVRYLREETKAPVAAVQGYVGQQATAVRARVGSLRNGAVVIDEESDEKAQVQPEPVGPVKPRFPEASTRTPDRPAQTYRQFTPPQEPVADRGYAVTGGARPGTPALPPGDPAAAARATAADWPSGYGPATAQPRQNQGRPAWTPPPADTGRRPSEWGNAGDTAPEETVGAPTTVLVTDGDGSVRQVNAVWTTDGPRFEVGSDPK